MKALHWVGGEWRGGNAGLAPTYNPADGTVVGEYALGCAKLAQLAVAAARRAFDQGTWASSPRLRASVLLQFADGIAARAAELTDVIMQESGKLRSEAAHEVGACISECRYYAGLARTIAGRVTELEGGQLAIFAREAAGVVAIIVPWNAPATLLVRSLAPALAAGCTAVVKPAPQTPNVNRIMMECLAAIGDLPAGVVNSVNEHGTEVGEALSLDPDVDVISFTGSSRTGKAIMAAASSTLKRLSLELGGKAPTLVAVDADLDLAIPTITRHATIMAGQMCTAITRVVVAQERFDEVAERLYRALSAVKTGRGDDPASTMGPVIDIASRDRLLGLVSEAGRDGELLLQGRAFDSGPLARGAFISPTLMHLDDVDHPLVQQELFGPILNLERATDETDMLRRANATRYGLAASVWTRDLGRAQRWTRCIRAGSVWVNTHNRLAAETETGGYKESGLGRLHGVEGLNDFLETKTVFYEQQAF